MNKNYGQDYSNKQEYINKTGNDFAVNGRAMKKIQSTSTYDNNEIYEAKEALKLLKQKTGKSLFKFQE